MTENWCWYLEGDGVLVDGFASRDAAILGAYADEADLRRLYIGTTSSAMDEAARVVDADDIADNLEEHLNVDGCRMRVLHGAQDALRAWVHEYLSYDVSTVCLDGDKPTEEEWKRARERFEQSQGGES